MNKKNSTGSRYKKHAIHTYNKTNEWKIKKKKQQHMNERRIGAVSLGLMSWKKAKECAQSSGTHESETFNVETWRGGKYAEERL